jgi:hypothetical protein
MDGARNHDHRLTLVYRALLSLAIAKLAWIGEPGLEAPKAVKILNRLRAGDERRKIRAALGRLAERADLDAIGALSNALKVRNHLVPVCQVTISARTVPEM